MIDQTHALIGHLDVEHLIETGEVRWSLIHVDLAVGREGIAAVQAAKTYHALPKFKIAAPSSPDVEQRAAEVEGVNAVPAAPPTSAANIPTRDELRARKDRMAANANDTGWGAEFQRQWKAHGIGKDSTDAEIMAALDAIEPPFEPKSQPVVETPAANPQPSVETDGDPIDKPTLDALLAAIKASDARSVVNGWLAQANDAGESWSPRVRPYVRQFEISRAALALAVATDGADEYARLLMRTACPRDEHFVSFFDVGRVLGSLTIAEARRVHAVAEAFGTTLHLIYDRDGTPRLDGDVAAVLGRVA